MLDANVGMANSNRADAIGPCVRSLPRHSRATMRPPFRMETGATTHRPRFFLGAPRPTYLRSGESFQRSLQSFRLGRLFGMILPRLGDRKSTRLNSSH